MTRESLYIGRIEDPKILSEMQLILKVTGEKVTDTETIESLPQNIRVASQDTIDSILGSFSKALTIKHVKDIPKSLPRQENALYFRLEKMGPFWEAICRSSSVAVFLPKEFMTFSIELLAVE
jgi:type VI secretion system protein ImpJ